MKPRKPAKQQLPLSLLLLMGVMHQTLLAAQAAEYAVTPRSSVIGQDIDCGQKEPNGTPRKFCRVSGGVIYVADACDANPKCKSFVMETTYSGYLKAGGKPVYTEGFNTFCQIGTPGCTGSYRMTRRMDIKGQDMNCNYKDYYGLPQKYCIIAGDLINQLAACNENVKCKAVISENGYDGYLKTAAAPAAYREGFVVYTKGV